MIDSADFDIEKSAGFLVAKAYQRLFACIRTELEPFNLTPPQFALLSFLSRQDGLTQTDLSLRTEIDRTTIGGLIKRLEKIGFVTRQNDPADRRAFRVYMTGRGREVQSAAAVAAVQIRSRFAGHFSDQEYAMLCQLLDKLRIRENSL